MKKYKKGTFSQENLIKKCEVKVDKILAAKECLRCGKEEPHYCETCFQEVIAENARLQKQIHDIKRILEKIEHTNYNNYTNRQDGNEVKYAILQEFKDVIEGIK